MNVRRSGSAIDDPRLFSELIGLVYDAAAAPELWPAFLARLASTLELRAANFVLSHPEADGRVAVLPATWGISDNELGDYESHFAAIDPHRLPTQRFASGTVGVGDLLVPDADYVRSEYFNDYYAPIGLRHGFASLIHNESGITSVLVCHRGPDHRQADAHELELLRRLTPHLQRAREVSARLGTLASQRGISSSVLDLLPIGLVFVDAAGRVLDANARGERILEQQDGLGLEQGSLVTGWEPDTRALHHVIDTVCRGGALEIDAAPTSLRIDRPSGRRALEVMACPIDRESSVWGDRGASAFLVLSDGEAELRGAATRLRDLHGLSEVEANLAVALASGMTVSEHAEERAVSVETVRWQLKQIFAKTGTSRQPELMRLVLLGPGLVR